MLGQTPLPQSGVGKLSQGSFLRIARDKDGVGNAWKSQNKTAKQAFGTASTLQQLKQQVNRLRKRIPSLVPQESFYPFKIYAPSNYPDSALIYDSSGNASSCAIDFTVPTNLPTTLNPSTDSWRIFAVRDGIFETRSFTTIGDDDESVQCNNSLLVDLAANLGFDILYGEGSGGTDGVSPFFNFSPAGTPLPNYTYDEQTTFVAGDGAFGGNILVYGGDYSSESCFSIWIDTFQGVIRCLDDEFLDGLNPNTPFLVPVGFVFWYGDAAHTSYVQQCLFDHAINRFPQGMYSPGALPTGIDDIKSGALNLRGSWTADSLSGQVFYDGDYVIDDSTDDETYYVAATSGGGVTTQLKLYGQYAYIGGCNIESTSPANDLTNWVKIGTIKL